MFDRIEPEQIRRPVIKLLLAYGCNARFRDMSFRELNDHLKEHEFDAYSGEWPEDP